MPFRIKHEGELGGAFPTIKGILSVGAIFSPLLNILRPLIAIFELFIQLQKLILYILMLPYMAAAAAAALIISIIQQVIDKLAELIKLFGRIGFDSVFSDYEYKGKIKELGPACTTYFAKGIPTSAPPNRRKKVYAMFLIANNENAWQGLDRLFGPAPAIPTEPEEPGAGPNRITAATIELHPGDYILLSWQNSNSNTFTYRVALVDVESGSYLIDTEGSVKEYGTGHEWTFEDVGKKGLVAGKQYKASVMFGSQVFESEAVTYAPELDTPPVDPGVVNDGPPLPIPASANITFLGRKNLHVWFPVFGALGDFIKGLERPLEQFKQLILRTVGRALQRKKGIEAAIDYATQSIRDLQKSITRLQRWIDAFGRFKLHFDGAFNVGTIYLCVYEGPINEMGPSITARTRSHPQGGLGDGSNGEQAIWGRIAIAEEGVAVAVLKFLTGG